MAGGPASPGTTGNLVGLAAGRISGLVCSLPHGAPLTTPVSDEMTAGPRVRPCARLSRVWWGPYGRLCDNLREECRAGGARVCGCRGERRSLGHRNVNLEDGWGLLTTCRVLLFHLIAEPYEAA